MSAAAAVRLGCTEAAYAIPEPRSSAIEDCRISQSRLLRFRITYGPLLRCCTESVPVGGVDVRTNGHGHRAGHRRGDGPADLRCPDQAARFRRRLPFRRVVRIDGN